MFQTLFWKITRTNLNMMLITFIWIRVCSYAMWSAPPSSCSAACDLLNVQAYAWFNVIGIPGYLYVVHRQILAGMHCIDGPPKSCLGNHASVCGFLNHLYCQSSLKNSLKLSGSVPFERWCIQSVVRQAWPVLNASLGLCARCHTHAHVYGAVWQFWIESLRASYARQ